MWHFELRLRVTIWVQLNGPLSLLIVASSIVCLPPFLTEIARRGWPRWELKVKPLLQKPPRSYAAAFEDQLGFRSQENGAKFEHPSTRRQTNGNSPRFSQHPH